MDNLNVKGKGLMCTPNLLHKKLLEQCKQMGRDCVQVTADLFLPYQFKTLYHGGFFS